MDWYMFVKIFGAILISVYLFFGIDDMIWFLYSTFSRWAHPGEKEEVLNFDKLRRCPPKLLAVTIAAWHESNVIGDVLVNFLNTTDYPKSMYHIFVGVYPNDPETIEAVQEVSRNFPNVHAIINDIDGPTTKAQNINCVIRRIREYEKEHNVRFASLTVHDSEDVVHTYELLSTNYLIKKHAALQFPVFPIVKMPKFSNFFSQLTTATYADEFAENHYIALVERRNVGAFVPCAGTGFTLSRRLIESYNGEDILPTDSLTEDYLLSLTLYKKGIKLHYVLNKLPRVLKSGKIKTDFITTRSLFPATFKAAIRQKTRWTYGIAMQSIGIKDVFTTEKISFAGRYSFYKDAKTKLVNLVPLFGYIASVYCILALIFNLTPLYDPGTPVFYMAMVVFGMMILHQIFRAYALYNVYGFRSVFFGCLLPPLFPIRLIYGNIINFVATFKAFKLKLFGTKKTVKKKNKEAIGKKRNSEKKVKWAKTDHEFLSKQQLRNYRRMLGDVLITQGFLTPAQFRKSLSEVDKEHGEKIGTHLIREGYITKEDFLRSLGFVKHVVYIPTSVLRRLDYQKILPDFRLEELRQKRILPLAYENGCCMIGICEETGDEDLKWFSETYGLPYKRMFVLESDILGALDDADVMSHPDEPLECLKVFQKGLINFEQAILIGTYAEMLGRNEEIISEEMGLRWQ